MTKEQALHSFWSQFGMTAYDENTIPSNAVLPYITYEVATGSIGDVISMTASIWDRSPSWANVTDKSNEIAEYIGLGGATVPFDNGILWITKGSPFSQRTASDNGDDVIRRVILNIQAEYISAI